jgi:glycosyltransferase 2 family protein
VVGFMTGLFVPRAGEVVRPYLIGRRHGIRISAAFASIILERLVDLITVLILFGLYLYVLPAPAAQTRGPLLRVLKVGGGAAALAALAVLGVLVAFHLHAERALAVLGRLLRWLPARLATPLEQMLRSFGEGLAVLKAPPGHLLAILAQSFVVWLSIAAGFYWNNRAFGLDLPFQSSFLLISFLTVGVAVPTPGMVGGFHESYLLALTQAYGVDKEVAAAAGIAGHALTNLPILILGLALLGREGLTLGKVARMTEHAPKEDAP